MPRIYFSRQHSRLDLVHAVHREPLTRIGIVHRWYRIQHTDPHIQPGVAIQDIVTNLAFQDVAAAATEQDIGRGVADKSDIALVITSHGSLVHHYHRVLLAVPSERFTS
ncbi:hypothetical protein D9M68_694160 [compost metagenome]